MVIENFTFGSIRVDGVEYGHDIVVDRGHIRKRKKGPSKEFRDQFGHTPLTTKEEIPWHCHLLVIGTGMDGRLPVSPDVKQEAKCRHVQLRVLPTGQAIDLLNTHPSATNAVLHVTC
jgi:hypothetical protein